MDVQPHTASGYVPISRREARRAKRRLDERLHLAPGDPLDFVDCMALGAWRRLASGERAFTRTMWDLINQLSDGRGRAQVRRTTTPARELTGPEAVDLYRNMVALHASLATGHSTYGSPETDAKALLAAAGVIAALELGATRFAGQSLVDFIDQPLD